MIDVIIPSFKDIRILDTIRSIKRYENLNKINLFRLIIIDGGSEFNFVKSVAENLEINDILISEKDNGIFDALNKGLNLASSDYVWWIGSDDLMNINIPLDYFEFIQTSYSKYDCFNFKNFYFNENDLTRSSSLNKYKNWYYKYGIELSHFSTIWNRNFIADIRFDLSFKNASDLDFFYKLVVIKKAKIYNFSRVLSFMREGGNSSKNLSARKKNYLEILKIYKKYSINIFFILPVIIRIFSKILSKLKFNISKLDKLDFNLTVIK